MTFSLVCMSMSCGINLEFTHYSQLSWDKKMVRYVFCSRFFLIIITISSSSKSKTFNITRLTTDNNEYLLSTYISKQHYIFFRVHINIIVFLLLVYHITSHTCKTVIIWRVYTPTTTTQENLHNILLYM